MKSVVNETGQEWETRKISVIGALQSFITQLRVGDDLTKISLPSALLFPFSGLEIAAARVLNHIDILMRANHEDDPMKRMLQVCRWYLTFTQQEKIGKKPYNPILGETHLVWVDHDKENQGIKGKTIYFSEQVSHHPPVAAYIVSNPTEKVHLSTNIQFGTHFHGNSVTANPTGATYIDFELHNERYEISKSMPDIGIKNVIIGTRRHSWKG